jgi:NAD(P)H dehydrogenase (quinone)
MYGHIAKLAEAEKKGIQAAGGQVDIYQYECLILAPSHG